MKNGTPIAVPYSLWLSPTLGQQSQRASEQTYRDFKYLSSSLLHDHSSPRVTRSR